jgi:hypothetical protein
LSSVAVAVPADADLWQGSPGRCSPDIPITSRSAATAAPRHFFRDEDYALYRDPLAERAVDWPWSSVHALLGYIDDGVTETWPAHERYPDFAAMLAAGEDEELSRCLRRAETIGRPVGNDGFLAALEREAGRSLAPRKRSRPARNSTLSPNEVLRG